MKYLTKQLIESSDFHSFVLGNNYEKDMSEYCEAFTGRADLSNEEKHAIFEQSYKEWIKYRYKKGIYKGNVVKQIIYDKDGNLKSLNKVIYNELGKLRAKFKKIFERQIKRVNKNSKTIKNGRFSHHLKKLAELNKHDADISFEKIEENKIKISYKAFGCDYNEESIFCLLPNEEKNFLDSSLYDRVRVLYEELFICDNNIFKYNILISKTLKNNPDIDELEEISILFSKVDVKRIENNSEE